MKDEQLQEIKKLETTDEEHQKYLDDNAKEIAGMKQQFEQA